MLISNKKGSAINGLCSSTSKHECLHQSSSTSSMEVKVFYAIKQKMFSRLDSPYGVCKEREQQNDYMNFIYSEKLCTDTAKSKDFFGYCGCKSMKYIYNSSSPDESCFNMFETNTLRFVLNVMCESTYKERVKFRCPWPCEETIYDMLVSYAEWPQDSMIKDFVERYILSLPCDSPVKWYHHKLYALHGERFPKQFTCNETEWPEYKVESNENGFGMVETYDIIRGALAGKNPNQIKNSTFKISFPPSHKAGSLEETESKWIKKYFYRLNVYFSEPTIESHKQVISLSFTDLMSSVGGVLGLWVGISAVSVIEMIVVVVKLCKQKATVEPIK